MRNGFTLIEVLISLAIFSYVLSSLIILFIQFSKGYENTGVCSNFSLLIIQKILTESDSLIVASTSDEVDMDDSILKFDNQGLYLFKVSEKNDYLKNKPNYLIDSCVVSFAKNSTSTNQLFNNSKCLDFQYKKGTLQTICALK